MFRSIRIIHRVTGIIGSIIVLVMAITGLLLNHRSLIGYNSTFAFQLQQFIFSLHSGAVDNVSFIWVTDLGAICMIVFSITGITMWFNIQRRNKKRNKKEK
ncbi:hypothetical protein [Heyndrickxia acidicola]|uniref:PepSY domain-containing protein n=1 Tax=Heyndrickxia acidicola TaxID=209389 RepID=A0ABU6MGJ4_9BACI|nr:hypothetical protein [Heyndrickxia acidicola]MED1203615.1 hypothetical protein [Heyndrickxia acidicola]